MRLSVRSLLLQVVAALLAVGVVRGPAPRAPMTREAAALLADGARWADSLVVATRAIDDDRALSAESAVALGYLERQRVGLGSPMRLIDLALEDDRLTLPVRRRLGWALLERTRRSQAAVVDATALRGVAPGKGLDSAAAVEHLALIERAVALAPDPRVGEQAVRLTYAMAGAEGIVPAVSMTRVLRVAALARDRALASEDALRLLESARRLDADPLALVSVWRRERWFAVERPPAADGLGLDRDPIERGAIAMVARLLDSVRATAARTGASAVPPPSPRSLLGPAASRRLAAIATRHAPPLAPVVVSVRGERAALDDDPRTAAFLRHARNEESIVAAQAALAASGPVAPAVARVVLDAAVGMRALAQEPVLHAEQRALTAKGTAQELGLAAISFDAGIPAAWRPYYLHMLSASVADLRRVLPDLSLDGLRVRFASESPNGAALAIHEPRSRTIVFPIETAAGTIAHEIAHDLDWQAARALYRRRGTYSTDVAVVRSDSKLAESLRGLTAARLIPPGADNGYRPPHQQRPAEVFARNVDWFVAVSLAREGRSNGYLSAVQDEALTGYASVLPREVGGRGGASLMDALGEMAFVSEATREWFLAHWGATRARRPSGIVRQAIAATPRRTVVVAGLGRMPLPASAGLEAPLREAVARCTDHPARDASAAASLSWLAADARARGLVRMRAEWYPESRRPAWAKAVLGLAPWSPTLASDAVRRTRAQLLTQLSGGGELSGPFEVEEASRVARLDCD